MALRDQPYIPLYVQDILTDEKLIECSASAHGVYFRLLCLLHKQETYGRIQLKAKYKQTESKIISFAEMLRKQMPFDITIISQSIQELVEERVLFIENDYLCQKRMIHDFDISSKRALSGAAGGKKGRNSGTKRYYNEPGYLYLIYDKDDLTAFKIGISAEPEKRIKGIIRKTGRVNLAFRHKWSVEDMGESEQKVLDYFDDIRDGEWIYGDYTVTEIENQIIPILNLSKPKPNSEIENEDEIESVIKKDKKSLEYLEGNIDNFRIDEFSNIDIDKEYKKFRDYLKSKGKQYKDYSAGFRNWLRSDFVPKIPEKKPIPFGFGCEPSDKKGFGF